MIERVLDERTGRWIDPRAVRPKPLTDEQLAEKERVRLEHRRRIKEKAAKAQVAYARYEELRGAIDEIERTKETLAAEHQAEVAPLQAEVAEIERRQVEAIAKKLHLSESDEKRRAKLLDDIRASTAKLSAAIDSQNRLIRAMEPEMMQAGRDSAEVEVTAELIAHGRADLLRTMRVAQSAASYAMARVNSAKEKVQQNPGNEFLTEELADAERDLAEKTSRVNAAIKAVVDE